MNYYEAVFSSDSPYAYDILTAALAEIGFDSFTEEEGVLKAYVPETDFNRALLEEMCRSYSGMLEFSYTLNFIPYRNWNEVWEANFQPIEIPGRLRVRAVFHEPDPAIPLELIIQPKMSFGTGHHATTYLVMEALLRNSPEGKKIMDFGTGTGILAILARRLGAVECFAVDNDPQCIENAAENLRLNHTPEIRLAEGDITAFGPQLYDMVVGNITRNVILDFLEDIAGRTKKGGCFIASGFYEEDLPVLSEAAQALGLLLKESRTKDKWCMAVFLKDR
jgi:ribosomal protein L11 methyltransferase